MSEYEIELVKSERRDIVVEATSLEEAIAKACADNPGFDIESVGDDRYMGRCESCRKVLTDGMDYAYDMEGDVMLCLPCGREIASDVEEFPTTPEQQ